LSEAAARPVSLIVAVSRNGVIGRENALPWRLPADLARFKALTLGKAVVMGRKTFESIGRPLPGRRNIVLSRSRADLAGVDVVTEFDAALAATDPAQELMVIGGAAVYRAALPFATRLYITVVEEQIEGDTLFPALDERAWLEIERLEHPADERNPYAMTFRTLVRRSAAGSAQ
jgi:dihydrofolate reductase